MTDDSFWEARIREFRDAVVGALDDLLLEGRIRDGHVFVLVRLSAPGHVYLRRVVYHDAREPCRNASANFEKVPLERAEGRGLEPCRHCGDKARRRAEARHRAEARRREGCITARPGNYALTASISAGRHSIASRQPG